MLSLEQTKGAVKLAYVLLGSLEKDLSVWQQMIEDASPQFITQLSSVFLWTIVLCLAVPIICYTILGLFIEVFHIALTMWPWYRKRNNRGAAITRVLNRVKSSSEWDDRIRAIVEEEYHDIEDNGSWISMVPQGYGGWELSTKQKVQ